MIKLQSSNLDSADYDTASQTLTIAFTSGSTYAYRGVPAEVFDRLQSAPSPGSYFAQSIRNAYQSERVS